jgi:hypothetical protein
MALTNIISDHTNVIPLDICHIIACYDVDHCASCLVSRPETPGYDNICKECNTYVCYECTYMYIDIHGIEFIDKCDKYYKNENVIFVSWYHHLHCFTHQELDESVYSSDYSNFK